MKKTNVMRILDQQKIAYEPGFYDVSDGVLDAVHVAEKIGLPPQKVFKTLVVEGEHEAIVCIIPGPAHLDLKKAAKAAGLKKVEMLPQKKLKPLTGYVHGGCSPIGLKKPLRTFLDVRARREGIIAISAGQIGVQVKLSAEALAEFIQAPFVDVVKEEECES